MTISESEMQLPADEPARGRVLWWIRHIESETQQPKHQAIIRRLSTAPQMGEVWKQLSRKDRETGMFYDPASPPVTTAIRDRDEEQAAAMGELLRFAFVAARDERRSTKITEVDAKRAEIEQQVRTLREVADLLFAAALAGATTQPNDAFNAANDAAAVRRVAAWREDQIETLATPDDPVVTTNEVINDLAKGVGVTIAEFMQARFGKPMLETTVKVASVAINDDVTVKMIRSALSRKKTAQNGQSAKG